MESRPACGVIRLGRVTVEYERAALNREDAGAFAVLAARGLREMERLTRRRTRGRLRFEVRSGGHISTVRGRTILLAAHRVRTHRAPYLHEIAHVLLPCRNAPEWFSEGLACYVESAVSEQGGGYDSRLFTGDGNRGVDEDARWWMNDARGRAVLPFAGRRGVPPGIGRDRHNVAAPFYVLSHSLVKFLAERAGVDSLVRAGRARRFAVELRRATGKTSAAWREEWLRTLDTKEAGTD